MCIRDSYYYGTHLDSVTSPPNIPTSQVESPPTPSSISSVIPPRSGRKNQNKREKGVDNVVASAGKRLCETRAEDQHDVSGRNVASKLRNLPKDQLIYLEKIIKLL